MGDIRDWGAFIRGRWDWSRGGYESGFPRGCQFTDVDARCGFDGREITIETKMHDGIGPCPYPPTGQLIELRADARAGKCVLVVYGCGPCNSPQAVRVLGCKRDEDQFLDWRGEPLEERRKKLKHQIDLGMGLLD